MPSVQETTKETRTLQPGEEVAQNKSDKDEVKRDQLLVHELEVMRRFCHTVSSKQANRSNSLYMCRTYCWRKLLILKITIVVKMPANSWKETLLRMTRYWAMTSVSGSRCPVKCWKRRTNTAFWPFFFPEHLSLVHQRQTIGLGGVLIYTPYTVQVEIIPTS